MTKAKPRSKPTQQVLPDLNRAIRSATWIGPEDAGTVKLARKLAAALDRTDDLSAIPPLANALQRSLASLGLTPDSRPGRKLEDAVDPVVQLRAVVDSRRNVSQDRDSSNG